MGGYGSGNWIRSNRKYTVEEALALSMASFSGQLRHLSSGRVTWKWNGGHASVGYLVRLGFTNTIVLNYQWRKLESVQTTIELQCTYPHFGGKRYWFTCPTITAGLMCNRRVGKLYSIPGQKYFGCRVCKDLSYRSSQEAHQLERIVNRALMLDRKAGFKES